MEMTKQLQDEIIHFTQKLVRCPGVSGDESNTASIVVQEMKKLGYDTVEVDKWGNVIGTIHGLKPGPVILFDGHMDVVPIQTPELWKHDPYGAEIADGKIWGRGTSDMKGGLASVICSAAFMDREKIAGTIIVTASTVEELMIGAGLQKVLESRKVNAVMTCEPTGIHNIAYAGVGRTTVEMTVNGLTAHSSKPQLGDNAVYRAIEACEKIKNIPRRLDLIFGNEVIELVEIKSRPSPGNGFVPDYCWVLWECRTLPGETEESFIERFNDAIKDIDNPNKVEFKIGEIKIKSYTGEWIQYHDFLNAWVTPPESAFRKLAIQALQEVNIDVNQVVFRACTNVNVSAGSMGIPSLIYGPGDLDLAHKPNENIEIDELLYSSKVYQKMMELIEFYKNQF